MLLFGGTDAYRQRELPRLSQAIERRFSAYVSQHVVTTDPVPPPTRDGSLLIDAELLLHGSYGVTHPAFYLIRPDGYVAARGPGFDEGAMVRFFETVFAVGAATAR